MGPNGFIQTRTLSVRFVDTTETRPRWRFNLAHRVDARLQLGLEWNAAANEVVPTGNWIVATETDSRPMVSVGTSSDRIFSPPGTRAWYVTAGKSTGRAAPYVSLFHSGWERRWRFPAGVNLQLSPHVDLLPMTDGRNAHVLLSHRREQSNISLMWIALRHPGIGMGWSY